MLRGSVAEVSLEALGDILLAINKDEGVAEFTLKPCACPIDLDILSTNCIITLFFLFLIVT